MAQRSDIRIKLFADGAVIQDMKRLYDAGSVQGFTTNPTLMKKAGITDYAAAAKDILKAIPDLPISFEVFSDDFESMEKEARIIATWGDNVNVKIPICNTKGESSIPLIAKLAKEGFKLNITALFTVEQVKEVAKVLNPNSLAIISVFAGRLADVGINPLPMMKECAEVLKDSPSAELLWASTREFINIFEAQDCGCKIITAPNDVLNKLSNLGKTPADLTLDTVRTFYADATSAGFSIV